jgi:DNA-binding transcriptional ArsR family regulator
MLTSGQAERRPAAYRKAGKDVWVPTAEVAERAGVRTESVVQFATRDRRHRGHKKVGSRHYITVELAESYLEPRGVPRVDVDPGWPTPADLIERSGAGPMYVYGRLRKPGVRLVRQANRLLVHPADFEQLVLEYRSLRSLPGWRLVGEVRDESGRSKEALNQWIRRNKIERRRYVSPRNGRPDYWIRDRDAERYLERTRERADRHTKRHLVDGGLTTRQRIYRLLRRRGRASTNDLVEFLAIDGSTVHRHLRILREAGRVKQVRRGNRNHPAAFETISQEER